MPTPIIRAATSADLEAIGRLGALLVRVHNDFDALRFIPATTSTEHGYHAYLGSQLRKSNVVILVAEQDELVVGYTYAVIEGWNYELLRGPAGVLHDIIVDPAHCGHGIGRMLLDATIAALHSGEVPRVVLVTASQNESAQRLFAAAGFRQTMIEMTRELTKDQP